MPAASRFRQPSYPRSNDSKKNRAITILPAIWKSWIATTHLANIHKTLTAAATTTCKNRFMYFASHMCLQLSLFRRVVFRVPTECFRCKISWMSHFVSLLTIFFFPGNFTHFLFALFRETVWRQFERSLEEPLNWHFRPPSAGVRGKLRHLNDKQRNRNQHKNVTWITIIAKWQPWLWWWWWWCWWCQVLVLSAGLAVISINANYLRPRMWRRRRVLCCCCWMCRGWRRVRERRGQLNWPKMQRELLTKYPMFQEKLVAL